VNKVATKVDMRFNVDAADWIPVAVRRKLEQMEANRINSEGDLVISSDRSRTQTANLKDCLEKLYKIIMRCSELPGETDPKTVLRVQNLQKRYTESRLRDKRIASSSKSTRSKRFDDD